MEQAEHALFRDMGTTIFPADFHDVRTRNPPFTFPRVRCDCEYLAPVKFEQVIEMRLHIERLGTKSVTYHHEMTVSDRVVARGRIIAVCSMHVDGKLMGCPIPDPLRASLSRYLNPSSESSA